MYLTNSCLKMTTQRTVGHLDGQLLVALYSPELGRDVTSKKLGTSGSETLLSQLSLYCVRLIHCIL